MFGKDQDEVRSDHKLMAISWADSRYDEMLNRIAENKRQSDACYEHLREAIVRLSKTLQLLLLEDNREIVDVPEHMEIRKAPKGK